MCPSRGGLGEKALYDGHYRDRSGFPGGRPPVRAWPEFYDGSLGGRHNGNRRLVRADRLVHREIRRRLARSEVGLLVTVGYTAFTEIVRRQLHLHAITFEHANVVLPHLT